MKFLFFLLFICTLSACGGSGGGGGSNQAQGVADYVGDIGGLTTRGPCSFEDNTNVGGTLAMSCELANANFRYLFVAEMVNNVTGYADLTVFPTGDRIRVEITWMDGDGRYPPTSFQVTTDPLMPPSATYTFTLE